jgi:two-component system chemotaxis response regulator CheB
VIGASAGGVDALLRLLPGCRPGYGLPVVIVLHCPPTAKAAWPSCSSSACRCRCAKPPTRRSSNPARCISPGRATICRSSRTAAFRSAASRRCTFRVPAIDVLMESAPTPTAPAGRHPAHRRQPRRRRRAWRHRQRGGLTVVQDPDEAAGGDHAASRHRACAYAAPDPAAGRSIRCCPCWRPDFMSVQAPKQTADRRRSAGKPARPGRPDPRRDRQVFQAAPAKRRWRCCWSTSSRWPSSTCRCRAWTASSWPS